MNSEANSIPPPRAHGGPITGAVVVDLAAGLVLALLMSAATWWLVGGPTSRFVLSVVLYLALCGLILLRAPAEFPGPGLGSANRVTLFRATLATPIAALALHPVGLGVTALWWIIGVSTLVLILDGLDGRIARDTRTATEFGARFDMELDAALILALSALVWADGRVGAWVLLIGLMRYLYVGAAWVWPVLAGELPESFRRKLVCVIQGIALLVALGPIIPDGLAVAAAGLGLVLLTYSFAVDVRWLIVTARHK